MPARFAAPKQVLLIEDIPDSVQAFMERLEALPGVAVVLVRTLDRAFSLIEKGLKPDLVILDLFMPENCQRLLQYKDRVRTTNFNQGELLGAALDDKQIPYFYYTSCRGFYCGKNVEAVVSKDEPIDVVVERAKLMLGV